MTKILLTGAGGFLGHHIIKELENTNYHVSCLCGHLDCNLLDSDTVISRFYREKPDIVLHVAGRVGGIGLNQSQPFSLMWQNLQMGMNIVEASLMTNVEKVVLMGTICSYPEIPNHIPFKEEDLWYGKSDFSNRPYGVAKLALMELLNAAERQNGLKHTTVMSANLYGPGDNFKDDSSHVIPALIKKFVYAKQNNLPEVSVWGNGTATRDFLYVEDAARAVVKAIEADVDVVNIGTGLESSIKFTANCIKSIVEYNGKIKWLTDEPNGQPRRVLDCTKAKETLGWTAKTGIYCGLRQTVDWYMENKNGSK